LQVQVLINQDNSSRNCQNNNDSEGNDRINS